MSDILVGEYLFRRLKEIGIDTIFGVPGDYELALLDLVPKAQLEWIGTPNELVGAYAVDGYARIKGAGALITTFGPGELSALCGIGGSFCELVPVLHIVGYPLTSVQQTDKILHHTLGDAKYEHYHKMSEEISCATAVLRDPKTAATEIDRVLNAMMYHRQPGYIGISQDIAYSMTSSVSLQRRIVTDLPPAKPSIEKQLTSEIIAKIESAQKPIIIIDGNGSRFTWEPLVAPLIEALPVPFFNTVLGKGIANEAHPLYCGNYAGAGSLSSVRGLVEDSDCILWLGQYPSDFNTGMFTENFRQAAVIDFQRFFTKIGDRKYDAGMVQILPKITSAIKASSIIQSRRYTGLARPAAVPAPRIISQDWLWDRLSSFLQPSDLVITETGTAQFGFTTTTMPPGSTNFSQGVWGSIGYASGAAVGASVAAKETGTYRRVVLVTGEGSLQLTVQAFALLNRHGVVPVVLVLNNSGYTVERYFNGWEASYNDVPDWDYSALFTAFAPGTGAKGYKVSTAEELDKLLASNEFQTARYPQCVDMVMDKADAPELLKATFGSRMKAEMTAHV